MIRWPARAGAALRKLFEPLQDIDVYVEDTNDEAFYRCLINSATGGIVKVARVFALGGRDAVIESARTHNPKSRPSLFIIDGDFPWVRGDSAPVIPGLHRHDSYCVENLIICRQALVHVLSQEAAITESDAEARLAYDNWEDSVKNSLLELFAAYATANEFAPTVPTVSVGVASLCCQPNKKHTTLDATKVNQARDGALQAAAQSVSLEAASLRYNEILTRIRSLHQPLNAISGKCFILPLIDFHLQFLGCRIRRKSLRIRLASAGDVTRFSALAQALKRTARGSP